MMVGVRYEGKVRMMVGVRYEGKVRMMVGVRYEGGVRESPNVLRKYEWWVYVMREG